jgi:hypothetical protein
LAQFKQQYPKKRLCHRIVPVEHDCLGGIRRGAAYVAQVAPELRAELPQIRVLGCQCDACIKLLLRFRKRFFTQRQAGGKPRYCKRLTSQSAKSGEQWPSRASTPLPDQFVRAKH